MINFNKEKKQHSLLHTPKEEKKISNPIVVAIVFAVIIIIAATMASIFLGMTVF